MPRSHRPFASIAAALLVLASVLASPAGAQAPPSCPDCVPVVDPCCAGVPAFSGSGDPPSYSSSNVVVVTRQPLPTYPYCVTMFNLNSPAPTEDVNWATVGRYEGPFNSWNQDSLGTVFGLTLDEYGNIYVTHTSCYWIDAVGQVNGAGPGAIYRIDAVTGKISVFLRLPNYQDPSVAWPDGYPGLGNISYDCTHHQFFVTDLEDGRIYRIHSNNANNASPAVIDQAFDPLGADPDAPGPHAINYIPVSPGWAPLGQRLWGVQWHGNRVYYGVWVQDSAMPGAPNQVRSVGLDGAGAIVTGTDQLELLPPNLPSTNFSMPVSDISFSPTGRMLLGERGIAAETYVAPHLARVLEYECQAFCWVAGNTYDVGQLMTTNGEGGVDYDNHAYSGGPVGRVWASGDHLHASVPYTDILYGFQGWRPPGGNILTSVLIDGDGDTTFGDKTSSGDIEAPGCPPVTTSSVCGMKYRDLNHNGVQDGAEAGVAGWTIVLNGPGGPYTATTDAAGQYCFTGLAAGTYIVSEVGQPGWVQTQPASVTYTVVVTGPAVYGGKVFGNYACSGTNCIVPPPGMVAWWPFNETSGTTAADITHLSPAKNVAQLFGGAAFGAGHVGNALCLAGELDYARVPYASSTGLSFPNQSFSIDAWVQMAPGTGGPRVIVDNRTLVSLSPYRTRGYALYLNGSQLFLEMGIGIAAQVAPGPFVTPGAWQHVAVAVDRTLVAGHWYLNGAASTAFDFVPAFGAANTTADLYIGRPGPSFGAGASFAGCIDDLEIFGSALSIASVQALYNAGAVGKCPEYVRLPQVTNICATQNSVQVCFTICNNAATPQSYHWSLAGLPVGPGCTVAGPTVFNPSSGTVTVAPGTCSANLCVTIPRPPGLTATNATSCYAVTIVNDATGACQTVKGTIRADNTCWCITPLSQAPVGVPASLPVGIIGIPVDIGIRNPCDPIQLPWRMSAVWTSAVHPDPALVSLNGLPPGEPVFGTMQPGPGGVDGTATVLVSLPNGHDPAALYDILLEADTDGDGVMDPICSVPIRLLADSAATTGVSPGPRELDSVRLQAAPNPFIGGSSIAFVLGSMDDVELGVFDLNGRLVRSLHSGRLAAGPHQFTWDGRDAGGRRAPAGVYFVRATSSRLRLDAKLVKLR